MICKDLQLWKRYPSKQFRTVTLVLAHSLFFFQVVKPFTFKIGRVPWKNEGSSRWWEVFCPFFWLQKSRGNLLPEASSAAWHRLPRTPWRAVWSVAPPTSRWAPPAPSSCVVTVRRRRRWTHRLGIQTAPRIGDEGGKVGRMVLRFFYQFSFVGGGRRLGGQFFGWNFAGFFGLRGKEMDCGEGWRREGFLKATVVTSLVLLEFLFFGEHSIIFFWGVVFLKDNGWCANQKDVIWKKGPMTSYDQGHILSIFLAIDIEVRIGQW